MIIFNGLKFAKNNNEVIESLFSDSTIVGTYRRYSNRFLLYELSGELLAAIIHNPKRNETLIVSATETNFGVFYAYGLNSLAEKYLDLCDVSVYDKKKMILKLFRSEG